MNELLLYPLLAAAGIAAGFLNTMAGGGSMLTLPVLMLLGLPADVANGTNRLAVVTQSMSGVLGFRRLGKLDERALVPVVTPTVLGAVAGATLAASVPAHVLKYVLLGTMMAMALVMTLFPRLVTAPEDGEARPGNRRLAGTAALLGAGLYGGFVQAGVGFLLLGALGGVLRYDLVRANALKLACTFLFGIAALAVFVIAGQVSWAPAALLAASTTVGALLGVRFAVRAPQHVLRWIILATVIATCVAALVKA
jgi:uncharacterized protein